MNVNNEKVHEGFMHSTGGLQISGTDFIGDCYMMAEDSIQYSVNTLNDNTDGRVVAYSENGDVNISGSKITINGILAAPNGTVRINADQVTINGRIYASSIELSGTRFNLYASDEDMDLLWEEADVTKIYDFNDDFNEGTCDNVLIENDGVVLDYGNEKGEKVTYEYQAEDEKGLRINVELDPNLVNQTTDKIHYSANIAPKKTTLIPDIEEDSYFTVFNGNLYAYVGKAMYWEDAKKFCEDCGGHLATISSAEENQVLRQLARGCDYTAIGFNDVEKEGDWVWVTGEEVTYTNWNGPEPNNGIGINVQDHGFMYSSGRWDDGFYDIIAPFFCEWEADSEVLCPAGRNVEYIVEVNGKATPAANSGWECVENENGTTTLVYYAEKLMPSEEIKLDFDIDVAENAQGYQTIISDSYCNYYDAMGRGHRIEMGEISFPVKKYVENGTWSVIYDSEIDDTKWSKVWWDAEQAGDSSVSVKVKAYNDEEGEVTEAEVVNGEELEDIQGRYIEIEATLMSGSDCRSPFLNRVMLASEKSSGSFDLSPTSAEGSIVSSDVMRVGGISNVYFMTGGGSEICSTDINWSLVPEKGSISEEDYSFKTVSPYLTAVTVRKAGTYTLTAESACGDTFVSASKKIKVRNIPALEDIEPLEGMKDVNVLITMPDYATPLTKISGEVHLPGGEGIKELTIYQDGEKLTTVNGQTFTAVIPEEGGKSVFDFEIVTKTDRTVKKQREVYIDYGEFTVDVTPDKEKYTEGDSATFTFDVHSDSPVCGTTVKYDNNELFYSWNSKIDIRGLSKGEHTVEVHMTNLSGKECVGSYTFTVEELKIPPRDVTRSFYIQLNRNTVSVGDEILAQVYGPFDSDWENVTIRVGDEELQHDQGRVSIIADKIGKYEFTATLKKDGQEYTAKTQCYAKNLSDNQPPTAEIKTPKNEEVITEPVDVVGTASDESGIDSWILKYRQVGSEEYQILAEGTENVEKDVLGHLDTTMLMNGTYEVVLEVTDQGGNIVTTTNNYVVEGNLKVGAMNIGFTDIDCSVAGIPLQVQRNYSSSNKTKGDFGYGWSMGMNDLQLRLMNDYYDGWEMTKTGSSFSTGYSLMETKSHDVIVTYGNGSSDRFEVVLNKNYQLYIPINETKIEYKCVTNPKLKLQIDGDNRFSTSGVLGENNLIGEDFEIMENPQKYILTLADGTKIYYDIKKGIQKMEDTRGNTVKITKNGYEHSTGKGLVFERDSENRVTKATDSNGEYKEYSYDENGDLVKVTDSAGREVSYTYDNEHNLASIIDPSGVAIARNEYDENGRLVAIIDPDGNRTEYEYDTDSKIQIVKDVLGGSTVYSYDDNGNILSKTDALGHKTSFTYDENNNVLSETDALNRTTNYEYDSMGNQTKLILPDGTEAKSAFNTTNQVTSIGTANKMLMEVDYDEFGDAESITNGNGNVTSYDYTTKGELKSITDEIGVYSRCSYDGSGNVTSMENGNGNKTSFVYDEKGNCISKTVTETVDGEKKTYTMKFEYDAAGNVVKSIDPEKGITIYEYDERGNKTASIDTNNNRTNFFYDSMDNLTEIQYADGTTELFTYDAAGNNLTATSRTGQTVTMEYDKLSQLKKKMDATGYSVEYSYDACGNLLETKDSEGAVTKYGYDDRNRNTSVTDALGNVSTYTYTETSQIETVTDALGNVTTFEYDGCDNCTAIIYADGSKVESEYDERGRLTKQKDQLGHANSFQYDGSDHLTAVVDALGNETRYEYNDAGELVSVTDALNHKTTYKYDGNSRLIETISAGDKSMKNTYDSSGNLASQSAWNGTITTYQYDEFGRVVEKKTGNSKIAYVYDKLSRLTEVNNQDGSIRYSYDKYGRLAARTDSRDIKVSYEYDSAGRIKEIQTPYGSTAYEYDLLDRVTKVIDRNGKATLYSYDKVGNRTEVKYPNGTVVSYTYDACNHLKEEWISETENALPHGYRYTIDSEGKRTKIEEITSTGEIYETNYSYDKLDRLTKESISYDENILTNTYEYDEVSNRVSKTTSIVGDVEKIADVNSGIATSVVKGTTIYTYNELNQLTKEQRPTETRTYTYDENGNLISEKSNKAGQLISNFKYNEYNQLIVSTQQIGNEVTITRYEYDAEGNRIASQTNEQDKLFYVNETTGLANVLAETDEKGNEKAFYTLGQERISLSVDGETWYYGYDGHGSTRMLLDESGEVTDTYSYDAWGNMLSKTGSTSNTYLYNGECYDANSGLYYLRARYMNPANGLFISMDTYQGNLYEPVTLHKYLYANANPVVYKDPTGNFSIMETQIGQTINAILEETCQHNNLKKAFMLLNVATTCYSTTRRAVTSLLEGESLGNVIGEWIKGQIIGAVVGLVIGFACTTFIPPVLLKIITAIVCIVMSLLIIPTMIKDWNNGDYDLVICDGLQIILAISSLFMKCFTGDTLVATEDGNRRIDEIEVGDYVWAENVETGEKELKKVLKVYVKETDHLVHIGTSTKEDIETTENHPFYTDNRGWVAAAELEEGDQLHTSDGRVVTVTYNRDEWLEEPIKVYNLEVEDLHTYFVTDDYVLVHNTYGEGGNDTTRVRHYTNSKGLKGIEESGIIYAQDNNRVYMEYAKKKPLSPRDAEEFYQISKGKGKNYIEFDIDTDLLELVENPRYHRMELTVKGDVKIKNAKFIKRK